MDSSLAVAQNQGPVSQPWLASPLQISGSGVEDSATVSLFLPAVGAAEAETFSEARRACAVP